MPAQRLPPVAQINASLSANRQLGQEFPENGKAQGYHTPIACWTFALLPTIAVTVGGVALLRHRTLHMKKRKVCFNYQQLHHFGNTLFSRWYQCSFIAHNICWSETNLNTHTYMTYVSLNRRHNQKGCVMAQASVGRPLIVKARFQSQVSQCGICGGPSDTGTGIFMFSPCIFDFKYFYSNLMHQYHLMLKSNN